MLSTSHSPILALVALTYLCSPILAQDSEYCDAVPSNHLKSNATASLDIPALRLDFLGDGEDFAIVNDSDRSWRLSSSIQPAEGQYEELANTTQTVVWLDTNESNTTRLGDRMRLCHNFIPLQIGNRVNLTWSRDTLEKSVQDTGDCRAMVSEACLQRLKVQYQSQAADERIKWTGCTKGNTTVPWECADSGMVEPVSRRNPDFNSTLALRIPLLLNSSVPDLLQNESLVCAGRNLSRSFGTMATTQDYDMGTNFPLMDIMTFFGSMPPGRVYSPWMHRVQIACLVPGQVTEGSREKASVESVLERYSGTSNDESAAARLFGRGMEMWALAAWVLVVGITSAT